MADRRTHALHEGELLIQRRMNSPVELVDNLPRYVDPTMPQQHADFYEGLSYLAVATMDEDGRPWGTLLVTKSDDDPAVGIRVSGPEELEILSLNGPADPFVRALERGGKKAADDEVLFAGVGVDFSNRRRNKLAGTLPYVEGVSQEQLKLTLRSQQHLGNCPKYITVRSLEPFPRTAEIAIDQFDSFNGSLPESCRDLIARASTVYLATRHVPAAETARPYERDMGLNHRGGAPGFVRVYEEKQSAGDATEEAYGSPVTTYVVLPDHSGNRFYQSLGNIQSDSLVGLTFPDFTNGDMLYLTGVAENLFANDAEALMPRVGLLTRVRITGAVYIRGAIQLQMTSSEEYSPYNPPVRYLRSELAQLRNVQDSKGPSNDEVHATLVSTQPLSESVRKFTFELSAPLDATMPGGFGIFDFSEHFDSTYLHMNETNPQSVNDDYLRTWTISSAATFSDESKNPEPLNQIDITVKRKDGGAVSGFLHDQPRLGDDNGSPPLRVRFVGNGGGFSCFTQNVPNELPTIPAQMLWIAGGVGITPFMSMWDGVLGLERALKNIDQQLVTDIVLVFAGRDDDLDLLKHFLSRASTDASKVRLRILAFQSVSEDTNLGSAAKDALVHAHPDAEMTIAHQRIDRASLAGIERLSERETYLCGPEGFMRHTQALLQSIVGADFRIHAESYSF